MALGPQQVTRKLNDITKAQVIQAEQFIDGELSRATTPGRQTIYFKSGEAPDGLVQVELVRRYKAAHWSHVEFGSCQRDGAWIILTP